jgi:hypothetical protein
LTVESRLDEFDKDEWREVCRLVRPDIEDEEFEELWKDFCRMKNFRSLH